MKLTIEVKDRGERDAMRAALDDPEVRAFVLIVGLLLPYPDRVRRRILTYAADATADREPVAVHVDDATGDDATLPA